MIGEVMQTLPNLLSTIEGDGLDKHTLCLNELTQPGFIDKADTELIASTCSVSRFVAVGISGCGIGSEVGGNPVLMMRKKSRRRKKKKSSNPSEFSFGCGNVSEEELMVEEEDEDEDATLPVMDLIWGLRHFLVTVMVSFQLFP